MSDIKKFELPVFKFNKSDVVSVEEFEKAKADIENGGKKRLEVGNHDLKVVSLHANSQNATDPSWYSYKITLADSEGREIRHYAMIPTKSARFEKEGSKQPYFLFIQLQKLLNAFGIQLSPNDLSPLAKLIGEDKLVGKTVNVDVGYDGPHVKMLEKGVYTIVDKNDQQLRDEEGETLTYPDFDSAKGDSLNRNIKLAFLSILKFNQPKKAVTTKAAGWDDEIDD
jgi:hypothetical protein